MKTAKEIANKNPLMEKIRSSITPEQVKEITKHFDNIDECFKELSDFVKDKEIKEFYISLIRNIVSERTAELEKEVERLREALREITNIYEVTYSYNKKFSRIYQISNKALNPQQDETGN